MIRAKYFPTLSLSLFLCFLVIQLFSCSSLKSKKDEEVFVEGTTVSLDDLEYAKGLNKPLPEGKKPQVDKGPPEGQQEPAEKTKRPSLSPSTAVSVRHLKKRILVLPFGNRTDYRDQPYGEIVAQKLIQALEGSNRVVILDGRLVERFTVERGIARNDFLEPLWIQELYRTHGIHALISGSLVELNVAATKSSVSRDIEVGLAIARIDARLLDASTGQTIRTYLGRNPLYKSKEIGEFSQERAILRAINVGVEDIVSGVLDSLSFLDWSARVVRIEPGRVYIDAGQQSGLRAGDILDVHGPGEEIVNPVTQVSIGWAPGTLRGRIKVAGFFGIDGAYATPLEGDDFRPEDVVKVSRKQEE
ncbi:MAG: hypothetical protein GTN81_11500 [Proteobacteria bacterium]|nr:hypothetical protein [Pseudomonadota bacterium]